MATEIALNEQGINSLIYDINSYTTKIRRVLYEYEKIVNTTKDNFDCEAATKLRKNFNSFKDNFPTIYNNLLSYKKDMFYVKQMFKSQEIILSRILHDEKRNIKSNK